MAVEESLATQQPFQLPCALTRNIMDSVVHDQFAVKIDAEDFEVSTGRLVSGQHMLAFLAGVKADSVGPTPLVQAVLSSLEFQHDRFVIGRVWKLFKGVQIVRKDHDYEADDFQAESGIFEEQIPQGWAPDCAQSSRTVA